ncbi:UPF0481 protein At3g47200-like [Cornus florida]|uniref:UPF0481 protein At3g47200-like n=1 Tax=Cornus florida TaxID=4283 RepID=UPI00289DB22D|nr:UPF0481 protein At3g47200-like [Cornus florida]
MARMDDRITSHGNGGEEYSSEDPCIPVLNSIRGKIDGLPPLSNDCCIFRVPKRLRDINEKAFTPQSVSIGPFHRGKEHLEAMEKDKVRYMQSFLNRTSTSLESFIRKVKDWEGSVRSCYTESINLSSKDFVEMILLDSCFIVEVIYRSYSSSSKQTDYLDRKVFTNKLIQDMILIENQLPFFVLEDLFNLSSIIPKQKTTSFIMLSIRYLKRFYVISHIEESFLRNAGVKNFVNLLRLCHLPSSPRSLPCNYVPVPTATQLQEAGMKFKKGSSNCMLDITRGSMELLEIPHLTIWSGTESLLLNLVALEEYQYLFDSYIIDYIYFMDRLIDSAKDVDLLVQNKIFENRLGDSSAVASLFNKLALQVSLCDRNYYYSDLSDSLNDYCNNWWHRSKAVLKRDYFCSPWRCVSTLAALTLLGLTLTQTICSILSL